MRFCPSCGTQLADTAKFCTQCGKKMPEIMPVAPAQPVYEAPAAPVYEAPAAPVQPVVDEDATQYVYSAPAAPVQPVVDEDATQYVYSAPAAPVQPVADEDATQYVYSAPAAPAYEAPAAPAYEAPVAPAYEAPVQQAYEPPVQSAPNSGSYVPPAAPQKPGKPTKTKKGNNKILFLVGGVVIALAVVAVLLISLLGGGSDKKAPEELGRYEAVSCMMDGEEVELDGEWIELMAKGKAEVYLLEETYEGKWSLDGDEFTFTQAGTDYTGTLEDGVLTLEFEDLEYTFEKEDADGEEEEDPDAEEEKEEEEEPELPEEVGYWVLSAVEVDGEPVPQEELDELEEMGIEVFLVLKEDGTGVFAGIEDEPVAVTWGDGLLSSVEDPEDGLAYSIEDGVFTIEVEEDERMMLVRGEGEAPEVEIPPVAEPAPDAPAAEEPAVEAPPAVEEAPAEKPAADSVVGYWSLVRIEGDDSITEDDIAVMKEMGMEIFMVLYEDGTGYLVADEPMEMIWGDGEIYPVDEPESPVAYSLVDGELRLENEGEAMIFAPGKGDHPEIPGLESSAPAAAGTADALADVMLGDYRVVVSGAEIVEDDDGEDAFRIFVDFTNGYDDAVFPLGELDFVVMQDGVELEEDYIWDNNYVIESDYAYTDIQPGVTIRFAMEYKLLDTATPIDVTIEEWWTEETLELTFDPSDMPGKPAKAYVVEQIWNPTFIEAQGLEGGGEYKDDYIVAIANAEVVEPAWSDQDVLRVYFEFVNNSDEAVSLYEISYIRVFQNGISLYGWASPAEEIPEDDNYELEIEPGEAIVASHCFYLIDETPVEIEVYDYSDGPCYGMVWGID